MDYAYLSIDSEIKYLGSYLYAGLTHMGNQCQREVFALENILEEGR